jgi:hypothetical protein
VSDRCDLARGTTADCNLNDIPDACDGFPVDFDRNGYVSAHDYVLFRNCLESAAPGSPGCSPLARSLADLEQDTDLDLDDFAEVQRLRYQLCP